MSSNLQHSSTDLENEVKVTKIWLSLHSAQVMYLYKFNVNHPLIQETEFTQPIYS